MSDLLTPKEGLVYVLALENGKFYVGYTNSKIRIIAHFQGEGSSWTKLHKPIAVVEHITPVYVDTEKQTTLRYMRLHGWENVRGGGWSQVNLAKKPTALQNEENK